MERIFGKLLFMKIYLRIPFTNRSNFLEGSLSRAWHVSQNRNLCALSTQHNPLPAIIISWLIVYPGSWLMTIALFLALFTDTQLIQNIDTFQICLAYLCLVMKTYYFSKIWIFSI